MTVELSCARRLASTQKRRCACEPCTVRSKRDSTDLIEPLPQPAAAERRRIHHRHGARPMRQQRASRRPRRAPGRDSPRSPSRAAPARSAPQPQHRGERKLAAALDLVQRYIAPHRRLERVGSVEAGELHLHLSSLRRLAMRAILRSDPPTPRLLSTNMHVAALRAVRGARGAGTRAVPPPAPECRSGRR